MWRWLRPWRLNRTWRRSIWESLVTTLNRPLIRTHRNRSERSLHFIRRWWRIRMSWSRSRILPSRKQRTPAMTRRTRTTTWWRAKSRSWKSTGSSEHRERTIKIFIMRPSDPVCRAGSSQVRRISTTTRSSKEASMASRTDTMEALSPPWAETENVNAWRTLAWVRIHWTGIYGILRTKRWLCRMKRIFKR